MEYKAEIKKELNQTLLRIIVPGVYLDDYQMNMIGENTIKGLVPVLEKGEGESTIYEYDITGMISMKQIYKEKKITFEEMKMFLQELQEESDEVICYLLDPNRLLLNPEFIFRRGDSYQFCYYPQGEDDIKNSFHRLMDDFVKWTDYQDVISVKAAFLLHKETMEENYSLRQISEKLLELEKKANEPGAVETYQDIIKRKQQSVWAESRVAETMYGSKIYEEPEDFWGPVKRFLYKHRRPGWGDYDGVYVNEEEY